MHTYRLPSGVTVSDATTIDVESFIQDKDLVHTTLICSEEGDSAWWDERREQCVTRKTIIIMCLHKETKFHRQP